MLGVNTFYFSLIRKYVVLFGTLFNSIHIPRYSANGQIDQLVAVPVLVGDKDKTLARVFADPTAGRTSAITLPRMSFQLAGIEYDKDRKLNPVENYTIQDTANTNNYKQQFNPVPYNLNFQLFVYAKEYEDGTKIIEQIVPFFTPEFTVRAELIPDMGIQANLPIVLQQSVTTEDNFDQGNIWDRRAIIWTLNFVMKAYFYGPIHDVGLIKFVIVNSRIPQENVGHDMNANNSGIVETLTVQPGMLANGSPTTNAAASVPYYQITITDDWEAAFTLTDFTEPPKHNTASAPYPQIER